MGYSKTFFIPEAKGLRKYLCKNPGLFHKKTKPASKDIWSFPRFYWVFFSLYFAQHRHTFAGLEFHSVRGEATFSDERAISNGTPDCLREQLIPLDQGETQARYPFFC